MPLTHKQRRARRKKIAEYCENNNVSRHQAAETFGVSVATVTDACQQHGVTLHHVKPAKYSSSFKVLYRLLQGERPCEIAKDLGMKRQAINHIKKRASDAGFDFTPDPGDPEELDDQHRHQPTNHDQIPNQVTICRLDRNSNTWIPIDNDDDPLANWAAP